MDRPIRPQTNVETLVEAGCGGALHVNFGLIFGRLLNGHYDMVAAISPELLPPIVPTRKPRIAPRSEIPETDTLKNKCRWRSPFPSTVNHSRAHRRTH
jgi:hypothetical protein